MKIIAPAFMGRHMYSNYDKMKDEIRNFIADYDDVCIDIDFLYPKEVDPYFKNILIDIILENREFLIRTKSQNKIKKVKEIFKKIKKDFSHIGIEDDYYIIKIEKD